jgi:hypothetical protein
MGDLPWCELEERVNWDDRRVFRAVMGIVVQEI